MKGWTEMAQSQLWSLERIAQRFLNTCRAAEIQLLGSLPPCSNFKFYFTFIRHIFVGINAQACMPNPPEPGSYFRSL